MYSSKGAQATYVSAMKCWYYGTSDNSTFMQNLWVINSCDHWFLDFAFVYNLKNVTLRKC